MYEDGMLTPQQQMCVPDVSFELVPIKNLVSNQEYQRPLSEGHIRNTLDEFNVYQINPVKVSRRDGINYVFDGQHTIEIVASASGSRDTPVWCMIYDELKYKEEAHIFADQQKHVKTLSPYEMYHAHIEAGDEKQMMIDSIVRSFGLKVTPNPQPNGICAINTIEKIFDKHGRRTLETTLRIGISTWEGEANSLSGSMLMGITKIVLAYGDLRREDVFKENVGRVPVKQIVRTAKERRPGALGYAEAMILAYNGRNKRGLSFNMLYDNSHNRIVDPEETDEAGGVGNSATANGGTGNGATGSGANVEGQSANEQNSGGQSGTGKNIAGE